MKRSVGEEDTSEGRWKRVPGGITFLTMASHREKGNAYYRQGKYDLSTREYTMSMEMECADDGVDRSRMLATLLANRAASLMGEGRMMEALVDAKESRLKDDQYFKAYYREACILQELERYDEAILCVDSGLRVVQYNIPEAHRKRLQTLREKCSAALTESKSKSKRDGGDESRREDTASKECDSEEERIEMLPHNKELTSLLDDAVVERDRLLRNAKDKSSPSPSSSPSVEEEDLPTHPPLRSSAEMAEELKKENEELKKQNEELKKENEAFRSRIDSLEKTIQEYESIITELKAGDCERIEENKERSICEISTDTGDADDASPCSDDWEHVDSAQTVTAKAAEQSNSETLSSSLDQGNEIQVTKGNEKVDEADDFSPLCVTLENLMRHTEGVSADFIRAMREDGFCYLLLPQFVIDDGAFDQTSRLLSNFFSQSSKSKAEFTSPDGVGYSKGVGEGEIFSYRAVHDMNIRWPETDLRESMQTSYQILEAVALKLLDVLSGGLQLDVSQLLSTRGDKTNSAHSAAFPTSLDVFTLPERGKIHKKDSLITLFPSSSSQFLKIEDRTGDLIDASSSSSNAILCCVGEQLGQFKQGFYRVPGIKFRCTKKGVTFSQDDGKATTATKKKKKKRDAKPPIAKTVMMEMSLYRPFPPNE